MKFIFFGSLLALISLATATTALGQATAPTTLGILRHNHLALHVKDLQTSAAFYRDILGLKPVPVPDSLVKIRAWFDMGDGQMVHLLSGRTETIVHDRNGGHIALFVKDIRASEQFLTAHQIKFHKQVRFDGVTQIYFSDPDGYLFELNEPKKI